MVRSKTHAEVQVMATISRSNQRMSDGKEEERESETGHRREREREKQEYMNRKCETGSKRVRQSSEKTKQQWISVV